MSTLYRFELKKLWSAKLVWMFLAVCSLLLLYKVQDQGTTAERSPYTDDAYVQVDAAVRGEMTAEKVQFVITQHDFYLEHLGSGELDAEALACYQIYDSLKYQYEYDKAAAEKVAQACEQQAFYLQHDNEVDAAKCALAAVVYADRTLSSYYNTADFYKWHCFQFTAFVQLIMILIGLLPIFLGEHEQKTLPLLRTARRGRMAVCGAKLLAALTYAVAVCLWFQLVEGAAFALFYHLDGWSQPLYGTEQLGFSVLGCSNLTFVFLNAGMRLLGGVVFGLLVLAVSQWFHNGLLPFLLCISGFAALLILSQQVPSVWNPLYAVQLSAYTDTFETVTIFGTTIFTWQFALLTMAIMGSALLLFIFGFQCLDGRLAFRNRRHKPC